MAKEHWDVIRAEFITSAVRADTDEEVHMAKEHWDVIRAEFITSAVRAEQYPKPYLPEVAFIGRSNVGKSSLINSVCRRNGLARVSSSPGKTQTLNFYRLDAIFPVTGSQGQTIRTRKRGPVLSASIWRKLRTWRWSASLWIYAII